MKGFLVPEQVYRQNPKATDAPTWNELEQYSMRVYTKKGYPSMRMRYRELDKDFFLVEAWLENMVKNKGVLGRAMSRLMSQYRVRRKFNPGGENQSKGWDYKVVGLATKWYYSGKRAGLIEYADTDGTNDERIIKNVEFDDRGRMIRYQDLSRGVNNERAVRYYFEDSGARGVAHWRGRYHEKVLDGYNNKTIVITRSKDGRPLDTNGDYSVKEFWLDGTLIKDCNYIAGKKHGFSREYNKFGRIISEVYYHHDTEVPDWVYLDPKSVTPEEIQDESDEKLREAMLELQGPELYQVRTMARSMKAIARARILETESTIQEEPIAVQRAR